MTLTPDTITPASLVPDDLTRDVNQLVDELHALEPAVADLAQQTHGLFWRIENHVYEACEALADQTRTAGLSESDTREAVDAYRQVLEAVAGTRLLWEALTGLVAHVETVTTCLAEDQAARRRTEASPLAGDQLDTLTT